MSQVISVRLSDEVLARFDRHIAECQSFQTRGQAAARLFEHYCEQREAFYERQGRGEEAAALRDGPPPVEGWDSDGADVGD